MAAPATAASSHGGFDLQRGTKNTSDLVELSGLELALTADVNICDGGGDDDTLSGAGDSCFQGMRGSAR